MRAVSQYSRDHHVAVLTLRVYSGGRSPIDRDLDNAEILRPEMCVRQTVRIEM